MENRACISKLGYLVSCVKSIFFSTLHVKCLDQVIMLPGYALSIISELQKKHPMHATVFAFWRGFCINVKDHPLSYLNNSELSWKPKILQKIRILMGVQFLIILCSKHSVLCFYGGF